MAHRDERVGAFEAQNVADGRTRDVFDMLRPLAEGDEQEVAALRVAECDYYLKRYGSARDALGVWINDARRRAEVRWSPSSRTTRGQKTR